jgi:hypothetical protein
MTSARCVNPLNLRALFIIRAQDLAGLRVHQMRLCARKARDLDVGQVIVFGVVSSPSLDVFACVGAAVQKRRHDLTLFFSRPRKIEHRDREPRDELF